MDNYKDFFIDINKFDADNIIYLKPIMFYKVCRNMGVYYKKDTKSKKQKIIIQTPKMVVPFGVKKFDNNGKKSYQMSLSFTTLTNLYNEEEIKKFYSFIQQIDRTNEETILEYQKKWNLPKNMSYRKTLQRLSKDYPHHINLNLPFDEKHGFLFNVYDENVTKSNIDILEKRSIVSVAMELTDLRFTDKEFRSNWTIMQIRKFKPFSAIHEIFMSECIICDKDDPEDKVHAQLIERYQKTIRTPIHLAIQNVQTGSGSSQTYLPPVQSKTEEKSEPVNVFQPPTLQELISAKGSLKKTETMVKGIMQDSVPIPPPLPAVKVSKKEKKSKPKSKKQDL